ncbi:srs domain-containing protein [Neospora caninum Liverpool]|uniref:Srs domain-containing protein n=1 Tax=Neospora caninum (strain Liverpool) TaxID=572307 RepID=F0V8B6_NEOCL|nr:srs domain-containing protein [Neospora caninum Liverpool]CBZ49957.1 srs domain-containing protein [Neospora caninum Liverpool]CEL64545.1 TPA: SRS domain-containing protein [Neospora caninum Liverpool]|eukprot:XP_003879992.1 srs domain-containing protein [Neospora caninum Liverpool]
MARLRRMHHRRGEFRSKARKLIAVCMGGVLLFSGGGTVSAEPVEALLRRSLTSGATGTQGESGAAEAVATCPLNDADSPSRGEATLTISKSSLTATIECQGESPTFVPTELTSVCDGQANDANRVSESDTCKIGAHAVGKKVTLQELLGASHPITWEMQQASDDSGQATTRTLQLAETDLPRTDKQFIVGCQKSGPGATPSCKVTVKVNARPSSVDDNNVVTCAHGKDSNKTTVEVEMSENKNTLTIDCGSDGSMQPEDYTSQYCSPQADNLDGCTKNNYSDILPTFASSWWTNTENKTQATLTIPKTDFPPADQRLLLGCVPKTQNANKPTKEESLTESVSETLACRVLVTVKASSSTSSASFTPHVIAATSGAALFPGLLSGSL